MPAPMKHSVGRKMAPMQDWKPGRDISTAPKDPPDVRAEKDRLIAAYLAKKEKTK